MNRTIEITFANGPEPRNKALQQAIGYLAMWGNANKATLHIDSDLDITAHYYRDDKHIYTIGAILDPLVNIYSFHS